MGLGGRVTREEHLLTALAEECAEVAHRAAKALRFGLAEVQPGEQLTNARRLRDEMLDLFAVWGMLCRDGWCLPIAPLDGPAIEAKQEKVEEFLEYSRQCGTLAEEPGPLPTWDGPRPHVDDRLLHGGAVTPEKAATIPAREVREDVVLTPAQFAGLMKAVAAGGKPEEDHDEADKLTCRVLESLGYGEGVNVFKKMTRRYS